MRGMTRIKIGGRYETRCCYKTLRNPRAGELLQQPPPTAADCSFAFGCKANLVSTFSHHINKNTLKKQGALIMI